MVTCCLSWGLLALWVASSWMVSYLIPVGLRIGDFGVKEPVVGPLFLYFGYLYFIMGSSCFMGSFHMDDILSYSLVTSDWGRALCDRASCWSSIFVLLVICGLSWRLLALWVAFSWIASYLISVWLRIVV
ncbi:hypothetical protein AVEN_169606-1 [Araneus ventricosus]|uniref:Uncharacterized protein n=1 Tax=Araneus ventricosus TaxID=182803 RepID=A0A4Y2HQS2_ARAVE|nr:hypothetical protein AVEN_169606-1 [Araneus ventricosus]